MKNNQQPIMINTAWMTMIPNRTLLVTLSRRTLGYLIWKSDISYSSRSSIFWKNYRKFWLQPSITWVSCRFYHHLWEITLIDNHPHWISTSTYDIPSTTRSLADHCLISAVPLEQAGYSNMKTSFQIGYTN